MIDLHTDRRYDCPFVVYAMDTPSFPSDEIWPYDPFLQRKQSIYGRRPGGLLRLFRPVSCHVEELHGSLIFISGGYLSSDDSDGGTASGQEKLRVQGILNMLHNVGARFAEKAVAELIGPDDRVTMLRYVSRDEAHDYLATVRAAGFEVIETGDVKPGVDSALALCRGTGRMLGAYQWLNQVWGYEPFFLHANRGPQCLLESRALAAALSKTDPQLPVIELLEQVQRRPKDAEAVFGQGYVHVHQTDPDGTSLHIARQDPDSSGVQDLFTRAAKAAGLALFDAGSLSQADSEGRHFTEFKFFYRWMPVPEDWRKLL